MILPAIPILWFAISCIALLAQLQFTIFGNQPDFTLLAAYIFGLKTCPVDASFQDHTDVRPEAKAVLFGALIGLAEDIVTGCQPGANLLSKGLAGFIGSVLFRDVFFTWSPLWGGAALALLTVADGLVVAGLRLLFLDLRLDLRHVAEVVMTQGMLNLPLGMLFRPGMQRGPSPAWSFRKKYS